MGWRRLFEDHIRAQPQWLASLAALDQLGALAEAEGFGVLIVLLPALLVLDDYYLAPVHAAITAHARALGFGVLDLAPRFQEAGEVADLRASEMDALHLSLEAHEVAASAIERRLVADRPWANANEDRPR